MKILLTGASGQVGFELARSLQSLGEVLALDRRAMDLGDLDHVRDVVRKIQPDLIVNPAAYTAVDQAEKEPELAMRINGLAPGVMAEEAARIGARMVHYSTDYVFDGSKLGAYLETDIPCPMNVYGRSKLAGERAVQASGIPHLILRTSWVYGMRGRNFLLTMQRLARERDELRVVADQTGAPTWCRTIADTTAVMLHLLHRADPSMGAKQRAEQCAEQWANRGGVYHLVAQGHTSWHGFAQAIVQGLPGDGARPRVTPIATSDYPLPAARPVNSVLSCEKLKQEFCCLPQWQTALALAMASDPA